MCVQSMNEIRESVFELSRTQVKTYGGGSGGATDLTPIYPRISSGDIIIAVFKILAILLKIYVWVMWPVLVSNNNMYMYINIKPYFCLLYLPILKYRVMDVPDSLTSFSSFPKLKQIWRFCFSGKWKLTKMMENQHISQILYFIWMENSLIASI